MTFWSSETWKSESMPGQVLGRSVVDPFDRDRVRQGSYELTLGDAYAISSADAARKFVKDKEQVCIPPGQFALLTTQEIVTIPADAIGWISIKSTLKLRGLVNISGFHVDPGFSHQLKFSVYNAGGSVVTLTRGARVFLLWLSRLDQPTKDLYPTEGLDEQWPITDSDVMNLSHELASPAQLRKDLDKVEEKVKLILGIAIAIFVWQMRGCFSASTETHQESKPPIVSPSTPGASVSSVPTAAPAATTTPTTGTPTNLPRKPPAPSRAKP